MQLGTYVEMHRVYSVQLIKFDYCWQRIFMLCKPFLCFTNESAHFSRDMPYVVGAKKLLSSIASLLCFFPEIVNCRGPSTDK